jgi:hypothetical protein
MAMTLGTQGTNNISGRPHRAQCSPAQIKRTATTKDTFEAQRSAEKLATIDPQASPPQQQPSVQPLQDAGGARTTNLLRRAVLTVPAGLALRLDD